MSDQSNSHLPEEIRNSAALMGLYFSVETSPEAEALLKNVGKTATFNKPIAMYYQGTFQIVGIQRIFDGSLAYRVIKTDKSWNDTFGCSARPSEISIRP